MTILIHRWHTPADFAPWRTETCPTGAQLFRSPSAALPAACSEIIPSWQADTPPGTAVEILLRVRYGYRWSSAYRLALWDSAQRGSRRTSFGAQRDADGYVCTDTLVVRPGADAVEASVICHGNGERRPLLRGLTLACSGADQGMFLPTDGCAPCRLSTPCFSQFSYVAEDGWCSPTSLAMVLGYWHERTGRPELAPFVAPGAVPNLVAPGVYDPQYEGYGNWSFNVAFAAALGLHSYVVRMDSLAAIGPWLEAGVPVVLSVAWDEGQLTGAPLPRSKGHLLVATGLTASGDVLVADPAGSNSAEVRRCYRRAELEACWLRPYGTAYLIYPPDWPAPAVGANVGQNSRRKLLAESTIV